MTNTELVFWICRFQVLQAGTNYGNSYTGQLSCLSLLLTWAGSLGVTFISLQVSSEESHSNTAAQMHILHLLLLLLLTVSASNVVYRKQEALLWLSHTHCQPVSAVSSWPRSSGTRAALPLKRRANRREGQRQINIHSHFIFKHIPKKCFVNLCLMQLWNKSLHAIFYCKTSCAVHLCKRELIWLRLLAFRFKFCSYWWVN